MMVSTLRLMGVAAVVASIAGCGKSAPETPVVPPVAAPAEAPAEEVTTLRPAAVMLDYIAGSADLLLAWMEVVRSGPVTTTSESPYLLDGAFSAGPDRRLVLWRDGPYTRGVRSGPGAATVNLLGTGAGGLFAGGWEGEDDATGSLVMALAQDRGLQVWSRSGDATAWGNPEQYRPDAESGAAVALARAAAPTAAPRGFKSLGTNLLDAGVMMGAIAPDEFGVTVDTWYDVALTAPDDVSGAYRSDSGEVLVLRKSHDWLIGAFSEGERRFVGAYYQGLVYGWWTQPPSFRPPDGGALLMRVVKGAGDRPTLRVRACTGVDEDWRAAGTFAAIDDPAAASVTALLSDGPGFENPLVRRAELFAPPPAEAMPPDLR